MLRSNILKEISDTRRLHLNNNKTNGEVLLFSFKYDTPSQKLTLGTTVIFIQWIVVAALEFINTQNY